MPSIRIGEQRLAYRLKESGPSSFVFVHGLGASKNSFDRCFEMDAFTGCTLASIDLPGCGESRGPEAFSYTIKDQAKLVSEWIQHLGLKRIILLGHSMGAVVCLYLAEDLGPKLKVFFNLEGNLDYDDCTFSAGVASSTLEDFEAYGLEAFKRSLREALQEYASPGLANYYQNISRAYPKGLYLSSLSLVEESREGNLKEKFLSLPVRKWYVFGESSMNLVTMSFLETHDIPYFIVPKSGHFMMDDQPEFFYRKLLEVLDL